MRISKFICIGLAIIIIQHIFSCTKTNGDSPLGGSLNDSIVYTDINPDSVILANHSHQVDMNNDGIFDFNFSVSQTLGRCAPDCNPTFDNTARVYRSDASDSNSVIDNSPTCEGCAFALDSNQIIDQAAHWSTASKILYDVQGCSCGTHYVAGYWGTASPQYLGVRFNKNDSVYYGWIKLIASDVFGNSSLIISGYAYNNISGHSISAGQKH